MPIVITHGSGKSTSATSARATTGIARINSSEEGLSGVDWRECYNTISFFMLTYMQCPLIWLLFNFISMVTSHALNGSTLMSSSSSSR